MTTTIFMNLLEPISEFFYKYKRGLDINQAYINTVRNYGFNTVFALNFGFELYQPFDINNITLQPGIFTTQSEYIIQPNLINTYNISVLNNIVLQELPSSISSSIIYENRTLPIKISISSNGSIINGIASNYIASVPYYNNNNFNESIIRSFESDFVSDDTLSILIFVNLQSATFTGINTQWTAESTSLYTINSYSYRYNNGWGQYFAQAPNVTIIPSALSVDLTSYNALYNSTYNMIYNWINYLIWTPNFTTWYDINKTIVPYFIQKFLQDYFSIV